MRRRLKRANGSGTIGCLNRDDLRKPYYVKVTVGHVLGDDGKRKQLRKVIGYYETEVDATIALAHYLEDVKNGSADGIQSGHKAVIKDIWNDFVTEQKGKGLSESRNKQYAYTWIHIPEKIKNATFDVLNYKSWADMFEDLKDNKKLGYSTLKRIRTDMAMMYDYAAKRDIDTKNYPRMYSLGKSPKKGKTLVFNKDEIRRLWNMYENRSGNAEAQYTVKVTLMLIYNGCRISEFLDLKTEDVHLSERYISIVDAKTKSGIRKIPIHKCVLPIYQELYDERNEYFLTNPNNNKKYTYANFRDSYWDRLRDELGWDENLTPHNCRKTFSSYMKFYNVDSTCQKNMLGHSGHLDLQEAVYTVVPITKLYEEINKIPSPTGLAELVD